MLRSRRHGRAIPRLSLSSYSMRCTGGRSLTGGCCAARKASSAGCCGVVLVLVSPGLDPDYSPAVVAQEALSTRCSKRSCRCRIRSVTGSAEPPDVSYDTIDQTKRRRLDSVTRRARLRAGHRQTWAELWPHPRVPSHNSLAQDPRYGQMEQHAATAAHRSSHSMLSKASRIASRSISAACLAGRSVVDR